MVQLISLGAQDAFLTGTPKQTYFVSVFKRNTPFFLNTVSIPFNGASRFGEPTLCTIPQTGDMIIGTALQSTLPRLGTPSNVYTYVGPLKNSFQIRVNGTTYTLKLPNPATTRDIILPQVEIDENLTIRAYNDSGSVGTVPGPVGGIVTYNSSTDVGILFTSSDSNVPGFNTLVTVSDLSIQYNGYSGQYPLEGFQSRSPVYKMPGPKPDSYLQTDVPVGNVYGHHWTWTFPNPKRFTSVDINVPISTSPLSQALVPGWVYVYGSNDGGQTWSLAGDPQRGTRFTMYSGGPSWTTLRILVASAGTYAFLVSSFIFKGPAVATINTLSQNVTDLLCLESQNVTINGIRQSDILVSQSPVWSYTTERNITYKSEAGNLIIDNSTFRIGGQTLNEIPGEYICLSQDLSVPDENQIGLVALTGKNDTQLVTSPKTYLAKIPFFDLLPVCALRHHDVDIQIQVASFKDLVSYRGLGLLDPTSQSTVVSVGPVDVSTQTRPIYQRPNTYFTNSSGLFAFNSEQFFTIDNSITGNLISLCSNIYTFTGSQLIDVNRPSAPVNITGTVTGTDNRGTIYVFNQVSNIFTSYTDALTYSNSFVQNQTLNLPAGYVNATVSYIDLIQAQTRTVNVPLVIRETGTFTSSTIVQIVTDGLGNYYANSTVPYITNFVWDADYNSNSYYSVDHTYQYQFGTQYTSNTAPYASTEPTFKWSSPSVTGLFPGTYNSKNNYYSSSSIGSAQLYYTGNFIESFRYTSFIDPYQVQPVDQNLQASFRYCRSSNNLVWKTVTTSNLNSLSVYRGFQSKQDRCANVLVGYQGCSFIAQTPVPPGSNVVVTYYNWDEGKFTTNVTTSGQYIDEPSTYEGPNGTLTTLGGTTTCVFFGSDIVFCGPLPIYSVHIDDDPDLLHRPIQGLALSRSFSFGQTIVIDGSLSYTVKQNVSEWVTDRLYVSNGTFYGLGTINGTQETYGTTSDIKTLLDQGLVVLSDSTPWQNRLNRDRVYYTGTTWSLLSNLWPNTLEVSFDGKLISAPPSTFEQVLVQSGFGSISRAVEPTGKWTLQGATFATCYDYRTRWILGFRDDQVIPITYYQNPKVFLNVGGLPDFSSARPISDITCETCTDSKNRIYTASQGSFPYVIQVSGNTVSVCDYTGQYTPNRQLIPTTQIFFTSITDGRTIYWITRGGTIISYDSTKEFGTDGSFKLFGTHLVNDIYSATLTKQYIVLSTSTDSNLYFIDVRTKQVTKVPIDRQSGILSWDGARYLTVFDSTSPSNSVLQIDTITYTEPSEIQMNMIIEYALVSETERSLFVNSDNDHIFKQIHVEEFVIRAGVEEDQFEVYFKNLVSEFFFTLDGNPTDDFISIAMSLNGYPLIDYDDNGSDLSLSKIQPYEHHTRIPDRAFWMYSFAKYPEKMNPSGFINMSRIRDQIISVRVNPSQVDRKFRIWATTYNVIKFRDGLCGLLY